MARVAGTAAAIWGISRTSPVPPATAQVTAKRCTAFSAYPNPDGEMVRGTLPLQLAQSAAHKAKLTATSEALADELRTAREQV